MHTLSFSLPASRDEFWAKGTYGEVRFEVPAIFNADGTCNAEATAEKIGTEVVDQYLTHRNTQMVAAQITTGAPIRDRLYVAGQIIRTDFTVSSPQAAPILADLEQAFPGIADYRSNPANLIGRYDAYRPPYENPSISWYEMARPPTALLSQYGAGGYRSYMDWYGLKFDLVSGDILLKVVLGADCFTDAAMPPLPRGARFFARIHRSDGSVTPDVDSYILSDHQVMRDYCQSIGHPTPYPDENPDSVWLYGVTFNIDTQLIEVVKAYERTVSGVSAPPCLPRGLWLKCGDGRDPAYECIGHRHWSASEACPADRSFCRDARPTPRLDAGAEACVGFGDGAQR